MKLRNLIVRPLAVLLCSAFSARAADIGGISLRDTAPVGGEVLPLRGAAVAKRAFVIDVYVIGVYAPDRDARPVEPLGAQAPRRLVIKMLRDVCGGDFTEAIKDAVEASARPAQRGRFASYVHQIEAVLSRRECTLRRGDTLAFDWVPGIGTVMLLNGTPVSEPEPDPLVYSALMDIWLGARPVDAGIKAALLGERILRAAR